MGWHSWWIDLMLKNTCWLKLLNNKQTVKNNNIQILYCLQRTGEGKSINYMWHTVSNNLFYSYAYALLVWFPNMLYIHINPIEINRNGSCLTPLKTQVTNIKHSQIYTKVFFERCTHIPSCFHEFTVKISREHHQWRWRCPCEHPTSTHRHFPRSGQCSFWRPRDHPLARCRGAAVPQCPQQYPAADGVPSRPSLGFAPAQ